MMKRLNAIHNQGYTQALLDVQNTMEVLGKRVVVYYKPGEPQKWVTGYDATMAILKLLLSDGYARRRYKDGDEFIWLRLEGKGRKREVVAFVKDDPREGRA